MKIATLLAIFFVPLLSQHPDQMVTVLDENTFLPYTRLRFDGEAYRATGLNWLVMFQVSWCQACKASLPTWIELSEVLSKSMRRRGLGSNIRMGVVDCDKNFALAQQFLVEGYPTFLYMTQEGVFKYQGFRTVEGFIEFLERGYRDSPKVDVKELSLLNLLWQLYRQVGITTIVVGALIATWLAYLCSGIFLKAIQPK